ncbi:MAG: histidine phosphatase family protein [Anaerolineae bacterium]|nr:histidine phosphatase family protein [Anaerolineae bacterium]
MQLLFLRHGIAVDHGAPGYEDNDDGRPLTDEGRRVARGVARGLKTLAEPDVILTSPLPRARQTADIVGAVLKVQVIETPLLGLSFDPPQLMEALQLALTTTARAELSQVVLVGHEPSMSTTVGALAGPGLNMLFKKTGLARVDVADLSLAGGQLRWLLTPGHLRRLGQRRR